MYTLSAKNMTIRMGDDFKYIDSILIGGKEVLYREKHSPLFKISLRHTDGKATTVNAFDAKNVTLTENGAIFGGFTSDVMNMEKLSVRVFLTEEIGNPSWRISVAPNDPHILAEFADFPLVTLPALKENSKDGKGGEILFPYNEGVVISDITRKEESSFRYREPEYPSHGSYAIFPNMICSQFIAYLSETGLYIGAHDTHRAVKGIDFFGDCDSVTLQLRLFCGTNFGDDFVMDYGIVFAPTSEKWESAAEIYRTWFESALPPRVRKIGENPDLPAWYADSPLVISYPVRGRYDTDKMYPNAFFPYSNALPLIDEIRNAVDSRLLVLLMHWEGTAPWAPPYVWPPYGGADILNEFKNKLHEKGDLLGVYCSGFGYTMRSNLVKEYTREAEYEEKGLSAAMCAGYDGKVAISNICQSQRSGYDICPASKEGRAILDEAYAPLFENGLDYVQILDQNHGGSQYFCHSREHGHPASPGKWMTENMQGMLSDWNDKAGKTLFGCESASAEPFIGNLLFSDNRFELNYRIGKPVPMYAYLYHEYLRNFMGNQVGCPFYPDSDTLASRIAYSFAAGDCMTLVFSPDGELMPHWGTPRYTKPPKKDKVLKLISNLTRFYKEEGKPYLYDGRMLPSPTLECGTDEFPQREPHLRPITLPHAYATRWQSTDGRIATIAVNPRETETQCVIDGVKTAIPPLDAVIIESRE